jgi:hypothetical protein
MATRMVDNNLDQQYPLPEEELTVEHVVGDLSPDGMAHLHGALKQLGLELLPLVAEEDDTVAAPPTGPTA